MEPDDSGTTKEKEKGGATTWHSGHTVEDTPTTKGGAGIGGVPKCMIPNMTDGKSFLEEEMFIETDEELALTHWLGCSSTSC